VQQGNTGKQANEQGGAGQEGKRQMARGQAGKRREDYIVPQMPQEIMPVRARRVVTISPLSPLTIDQFWRRE
jgi:hypothetical protein